MKTRVLAFLLVGGVAWAGQDPIFSTGFEPSFTVGGNITGLDALGESIEISLNGVIQSTETMDGTYTSVDVIEAGQTYDVTIDNNNCTVMNGSGVMPHQAVINADIDCPLAFTTVYDVKQGLATGKVALQNMLVTACEDSFGYYIQTIPIDADYTGDDYSAVFVFDPNIDCGVLQPGDRVDINPATVDVFFDEIQLNNATYAIQSTGNALPTPVLTSVAALDQMTPHPLNAVVVEVANVTVTDTNAQEGDFTVDMSLPINDRFYFSAPLPEIGEPMTHVRGPLAWYFSKNEIRPRFEADLGRVKRLVINEVDYDQPGSDAEEFIEVYNPGPALDTSNLGIHLVNGTTNVSYDFLPLSSINGGVLMHDQYVVFGSQPVLDALPGSAHGILFTGPIQNGSPDGLILVDDVNQIIFDSLSYEGEITATDIGFTNPVNLVEGTATPVEDNNSVVGALIRSPNGKDMDDASIDWALTTILTPGFSNDVSPSNGLVINEVDYDQPGTDSEEFIELYNPTPGAIDLNGIDLVLINGSTNQEYDRINLSGNLAAGQFAVIGQAAVLANLPQNVLSFNSNAGIQNGSPDGMALVQNNTLIDALSYEGAITQAVITGFANPVNLVEGNATAATDDNAGDGAIIRFPDGNDTGDDATDFKLSVNVTPGLPNNQ